MRSITAKALVPGMRQETQFTCMAASLCAAIRAWGKDVTESDVNKVLQCQALRGARWEEALATAQYFGMRATLTTPATLQTLKNWTDDGIPVLIAWNPESRPWSHASTVYDVDNQYVWVMDPNMPDPAKTTRKVPHDEFYKKWIEKVNDSLIVRRPACAIQREITVDGHQVFASKTSRFQPGNPEISLVRDGVEVTLPVSEDVALKDVRSAVPELTKHVKRVAEALKSEFSEVRPLGWVLLKNPSRFVERIQVTGSNSRKQSLLDALKNLRGIQVKRASEVSPEEMSLMASRIADRHISRKF